MLAYWALTNDVDDFSRGVACGRRLADFYEAFEQLLRPKNKPDPGWKTKPAEMMRTRLTEACLDLKPDDESIGGCKTDSSVICNSANVGLVSAVAESMVRICLANEMR